MFGDVGSFPHAEHAARTVMSLPMHPYLDEAQQKKIVSCLSEVLEQDQIEA